MVLFGAVRLSIFIFLIVPPEAMPEFGFVCGAPSPLKSMIYFAERAVASGAAPRSGNFFESTNFKMLRLLLLAPFQGFKRSGLGPFLPG